MHRFLEARVADYMTQPAVTVAPDTLLRDLEEQFAHYDFNGFPVLASILAQHSYLPRQLHTRGDRLVFSNGIVLLAAFAVALIIGFDANLDRLIQLYIVGVFTSFTLSQAGMVWMIMCYQQMLDILQFYAPSLEDTEQFG